MSLVLNDNIVLTDLAYEKARRLGMSLVSAHTSAPPAAPVRPYLSQQNQIVEREQATTPPPSTSSRQDFVPQNIDAAGYLQPQPNVGTDPAQLRQQLQGQMTARFPEMDPVLLNEIIERVLHRFGID